MTVREPIYLHLSNGSDNLMMQRARVRAFNLMAEPPWERPLYLFLSFEVFL
jgi:hypothetical protein